MPTEEGTVRVGTEHFFLAYNAALFVNFTLFGVLWFLVGCRRRAAIKLTTEKYGAEKLKLKATPQISFVLPVKGTHVNSSTSWISQVNQHGYSGPVEFVFVVQEESDSAYTLLRQMQEEGQLPSTGVRVLVAGIATRTSQKLHNMIYAIERVSAESELVLMLDDDMLLNPGAVNWLVYELQDPHVLAASGFSCDVPAANSIVAHAACVLRLVLDISFSSGWASAAWGGCCMMRRADLLDTVEDGVMRHWKNNGYSDDWIVTQVAKRHKKRIANPPCLLFLNLVDITKMKKLYNFLLRQIFVMDTYIEADRCEQHRVESALLPHCLMLLSLCYAASLALLPLQFALLLIADDDPWEKRLERPDRALFVITFLGASPFCYLGAASAVRAQAALIRHLSPESGQILARDGRWSVWRAPCGFFLFNILSFFLAIEGYWGRSVVWSGVRYFKRRGRVHKVERVGNPNATVQVVVPQRKPSLKSTTTTTKPTSAPTPRSGCGASPELAERSGTAPCARAVPATPATPEDPEINGAAKNDHLDITVEMGDS